jgi:hypothetical protein
MKTSPPRSPFFYILIQCNAILLLQSLNNLKTTNASLIESIIKSCPLPLMIMSFIQWVIGMSNYILHCIDEKYVDTT